MRRYVNGRLVTPRGYSEPPGLNKKSQMPTTTPLFQPNNGYQDSAHTFNSMGSTVALPTSGNLIYPQNHGHNEVYGAQSFVSSASSSISPQPNSYQHSPSGPGPLTLQPDGHIQGNNHPSQPFWGANVNTPAKDTGGAGTEGIEDTDATSRKTQNFIDLTMASSESSPSPGANMTNPIDLTTASPMKSDDAMSVDSDFLSDLPDYLSDSDDFMDIDEVATSMTASSQQPHTANDMDIDVSDARPTSPLAWGIRVEKFGCAQCGFPAFQGKLSEADLVHLCRDMVDDIGLIHPYVKCRRCPQKTCFGCGGLGAESNPEEFVREGCVRISWCCDDGRLFLVWLLSCGIEHHSSVVDSCAPAKDASSSKGKSPANSIGVNELTELLGNFPDNPALTHLKHYKQPKLKANPKGIGYDEAYGALQSKASKKGNADAARSLHMRDGKRCLIHPPDRTFTSCFQALAELIPRPQDISADSRTTREFVSHSPLLATMVNLLRNDSMENMSASFEMYDSVLFLIEALLANTHTASLIYEPSKSSSKTGRLYQLSFPDAPLWESASMREVEKGPSLADMLRKVAEKANRVVTRAAQFPSDFGSNEGKKMVQLCKHMVSVYTSVAMRRRETDGQVERNIAPSPKDNVVKTEEDFERWHRKNCVAEVPDQIMESAICWGSFIQDKGVAAKGRMKTIFSEINMMMDSLPHGIYVRYGSSRIEGMKALIMGPRGTPYENGAFEFDILLPMGYPETPPKVQFRTTGGGTVRFNPNLYASGKVCLSLLGTWSGQPWIPRQSTLMQVLVSLQAMIFCAEPWYNEPGFEMTKNDQHSVQYNEGIRSHTIKLAMLDWLDLLQKHNEEEKVKKEAEATLQNTLNVTTRRITNAKSLIAQAVSSTVGGTKKDDNRLEVWHDVLVKHFSVRAKEIIQSTVKDGNTIKSREKKKLHDALTALKFL